MPDEDSFFEDFDFAFEEGASSSNIEEEAVSYGDVDVDIPNYGMPLENHKAASELIDLRRKQHELDIEILDLEKKKHKLTVEKTMLPQRKFYAGCISFISISWLSFIGACVWNSGRQFLIVSDSVLIALVTTTTINVLGLFYIVARWLFPQKTNYRNEVKTNKE